jgi:cytochrome c-type biogenesis protein CcmH/NrfG
LLRTGQIHLQRGEYEAAVATYTAAVQLDPQNVVAYTNRGAARAGL